ncbi:unnamed protein product, partial [Prorocentrum cordatum]
PGRGAEPSQLGEAAAAWRRLIGGGFAEQTPEPASAPSGSGESAATHQDVPPRPSRPAGVADSALERCSSAPSSCSCEARGAAEARSPARTGLQQVLAGLAGDRPQEDERSPAVDGAVGWPPGLSSLGLASPATATPPPQDACQPRAQEWPAGLQGHGAEQDKQILAPHGVLEAAWVLQRGARSLSHGTSSRAGPRGDDDDSADEITRTVSPDGLGARPAEPRQVSRTLSFEAPEPAGASSAGPLPRTPPEADGSSGMPAHAAGAGGSDSTPGGGLPRGGLRPWSPPGAPPGAGGGPAGAASHAGLALHGSPAEPPRLGGSYHAAPSADSSSQKPHPRGAGGQDGVPELQATGPQQAGRAQRCCKHDRGNAKFGGWQL